METKVLTGNGKPVRLEFRDRFIRGFYREFLVRERIRYIRSLFCQIIEEKSCDGFIRALHHLGRLSRG